MGKKFSIIIPTMWKSQKIFTMLEYYENSNYVGEIILIDNDTSKTPDLSSYKKLVYYTENKNLYVNPSWNVGYSLSNYEVILANDDIIIENLDEVLISFCNCNFDIVGASPKKNSTLIIEEITDFPGNNYGCFMYVKNYFYIPEKYKIWFGDNFLFYSNKKRGIIKCPFFEISKSQTLDSNGMELRKTIAKKDTLLYEADNNFIPKKSDTKLNLLAVLVNFGKDQLNYLEQVVNELKSFTSYNVTVIVNSNIPLSIKNIDKVNIINNLSNNQLLPLTCRTTILENKENFDIFIYSENDHLFKEHHVDKHIEYSSFLPENKIPGLIQYEINETGYYYPAYHANYDWDYNSVETYNNKIFAHFKNVHQASFILTKKQLDKICEKHNFTYFFGSSHYSAKCRVNTDIYDFGGMKKLICISEFKYNLIHHLPNLYINGEKGRNKLRSEQKKMRLALNKLFINNKNKVINGFYLNLDRRIDRKKKMEVELLKTKHNIVRYKAIDGNELKELNGFNGTIAGSELKQYATYLSHLNMIKHAKNNKWDEILILEDDITLCSDFDDRLDLFMKTLPDDWKIAYIGFNGQPNSKIEYVSSSIYSVKNVYGCFGIMINGTFLDKLIEIIEKNKVAIDHVIHQFVLPNYSCYSFIPFLVYVNDDYSDLWNRYRVIDVIKNLYKDRFYPTSIYTINHTYPFNLQEKKITSLEHPLEHSDNKLTSKIASILKEYTEEEKQEIIKKRNEFLSKLNPLKPKILPKRESSIVRRPGIRGRNNFNP